MADSKGFVDNSLVRWFADVKRLFPYSRNYLLAKLGMYCPIIRAAMYPGIPGFFLVEVSGDR